MANKLLILGAAMAHKNKSYNLSRSIVPAVDAGVKTIVDELEVQRKRTNEASLLTQQYLDQLPENPEIDLLDENLAGMFTSDLNNIRNNIGRINMDRYKNAYKYSPGTEAYTNMMTELKTNEKLLKKRLKEAQDIQMAKSNWINEHANISETWKDFNPDKYIALTQILNKENPNYTAKRDSKGELILTTTIPSGKTVDVKVSDLDNWEEYPQPEINKINEFYEIAQKAGKQGLDIPAASVGQMTTYLNNFIGENEYAVLSLMFDDLPMGSNENKMAFFTEQELISMFDADKDGAVSQEEKQNWRPLDFRNMKNKVVDRIMKRIWEENKKARPPKATYFNNPEDSQSENLRKEMMANNTTRLIALLNDSKNLGIKEIINKIADSSYLAGSIAKVEGTSILPDENSISGMVIKSFDIKNAVAQFKKDGNVIPLIEKLMTKLGPTKKDRSAVYTDLYYYNQLSEDHKLRQISESGGLNPNKSN